MKKDMRLTAVRGCGLKDLRGKVFGDLTVLNRAPNHLNAQKKRIPMTYYRCQCSCGNIVEVAISGLLHDKRYSKRSCGGSLGNHKPKNKSTP